MNNWQIGRGKSRQFNFDRVFSLALQFPNGNRVCHADFDTHIKATRAAQEFASSEFRTWKRE